jgi:hypothetical protein
MTGRTGAFFYIKTLNNTLLGGGLNRVTRSQHDKRGQTRKKRMIFIKKDDN